MVFLIITVAVLLIFLYNKLFDTKSFLNDVKPFYRKIMEKDYEFLLHVKYKADDLDVNKLFEMRIRDGVLTVIVGIFVLYVTGYLSYLFAMGVLVLGFISFKSRYTSLKGYYKNRLHNMDTMLPYYLKSLEILIQHYTVPVAIGKSINDAPDIFKPGLRRMIDRINSGDATVDPYMEFANTYPVRDSMRMMRLLYRLGIGSQERKQERLMMFSRTVSSLQNKARETKYKERLDHMESQTMIMLVVTGIGVMLVILISMMMMF